MDSKVRAAALAAVLNSVGLPRSRRVTEVPVLKPFWFSIDHTPNVPREHVPPRAPAKVLPFVNHQARYKKLKRQAGK